PRTGRCSERRGSGRAAALDPTARVAGRPADHSNAAAVARYPSGAAACGGVDHPRSGRFRSVQYSLYGRNLPDILTLTLSPFGSGLRSIVISKSMALIMPSPNSSWINSFHVVP